MRQRDQTKGASEQPLVSESATQVKSIYGRASNIWGNRVEVEDRQGRKSLVDLGKNLVYAFGGIGIGFLVPFKLVFGLQVELGGRGKVGEKVCQGIHWTWSITRQKVLLIRIFTKRDVYEV